MRSDLLEERKDDKSMTELCHAVFTITFTHLISASTMTENGFDMSDVVEQNFLEDASVTASLLNACEERSSIKQRGENAFMVTSIDGGRYCTNYKNLVLNDFGQFRRLPGSTCWYVRTCGIRVQEDPNVRRTYCTSTAASWYGRDGLHGTHGSHGCKVQSAKSAKTKTIIL